ncbi:SRPBCC family protein [Rhizobium sp. 32-5/1]|uniref:SRPBCC family protein n=1 Tax=Rhizobium sp. 32-5/1 TaxID=3019602 RepID=UPI00240DA855|nr:SRPBCC family protein [Rhizobium sp. 32-5/1]WEZ85164.1 SRPBCC family protein [Rhizobium sp. 32-5/1]
MALMDAKIIHIGIDRPTDAVYAFASRPENMPLWASGLASGLRQTEDGWIAEGALGDIRIHFAPDNSFGIIDHTVVLPSGEAVFNALRVVPNGSGTEVMFTLLRQDGMSAEQFDADAAWVVKDLTTLKTILEREGQSK